MPKARSIECKCDYNFTCGYCLRNAKPWCWTLSDGGGIYEIPIQGRRNNQDGNQNQNQSGPAPGGDSSD